MEETKDPIYTLTKAIWKTFESGGSFSHNIIQMDLVKLSKISKESADKLYNELLERGY